MTVRIEIEEREKAFLSPFASLSSRTRGRLRPEEPCRLRSAYQRDRDRIVYSKAFRRLKHKTQVFLTPTRDHCRTRLTHTLEVAEIGRTIARAMRLNEDLVEAIALGHDLGHTPFGHAGEAVLNELVSGGFSHYRQSLRVVDVLEEDGRGLNLTFEVRDGIRNHSKGYGEVIPEGRKGLPCTAEGCVVRYADIIAYLSHDLDDAIRSGIISEDDVPDLCHRVMGRSHSQRIMTMVEAVIEATVPDKDGGKGCGGLAFGVTPRVGEAMRLLREFLFHNVYRAPVVHNEFLKASRMLRELFLYCMDNPDFVNSEMGDFGRSVSLERRVCDFIASMTDSYARNLYQKLFLPEKTG